MSEESIMIPFPSQRLKPLNMKLRMTEAEAVELLDKLREKGDIDWNVDYEMNHDPRGPFVISFTWVVAGENHEWDVYGYATPREAQQAVERADNGPEGPELLKRLEAAEAKLQELHPEEYQDVLVAAIDRGGIFFGKPSDRFGIVYRVLTADGWSDLAYASPTNAANAAKAYKSQREERRKKSYEEWNDVQFAPGETSSTTSSSFTYEFNDIVSSDDVGQSTQLESTENSSMPSNNDLNRVEYDSNGNPRKVAVQHVADVVRHGEAIVVPEKIPISAAIQILEKRAAYEEQVVAVSESIDTFPWDGAVALKRAMEERFGYGMAEAQDGFFGPIPPAEISIEVGFNKTVLVPWGKFTLPDSDKNNDSYIITSSDFIDGRVIFKLTGQVRRKFAPLVAELAQRVKEIVQQDSIYKGKALRIRFRDEDGDPISLPYPKFWDNSATPTEPIFSDSIDRMVKTNIITPIIHREAVAQAGVPFKRGVLLAGPYGTGKTMIANVVAHKAPANGITFIYLEDTRELAEGLRFAKMYQPSVIFTEDVDRATKGSDRTVEIDKILNTLDGIDSKDSQIMVVTTTNHVDDINQAMLRPGRFDVILSIEPPDAKAAEKLIRVYAGSLLNRHADLREVGEKISGQIPAVIREVVERSKLEVITRTGLPAQPGSILGEDLIAAAATMEQQRKLLTPKPIDNRSGIEKAASTLSEAITARVSKYPNGVDHSHDKEPTRLLAEVTKMNVIAGPNKET
jgi:transitional endoplasmic reticulum ATPase